MIRISFVLYWLLTLTACVSQSQDHDFYKPPTLVSFMDEKIGKVVLDNNFSLNFIKEDVVLVGEIKGDTVILPDFPQNINNYAIEFKFDKYHMVFDNIDTSFFNPGQKMQWEFVIDYPPFNEANSGFDLKNSSAIHYLTFNPLERGNGLEIIQPID